MHFNLQRFTWLSLGATLTLASPVRRNQASDSDGEVLSSFVGLSSSEVYSDNFGAQPTESFPPASVVGYPGATPTGIEPFVVSHEHDIYTNSFRSD